MSLDDLDDTPLSNARALAPATVEYLRYLEALLEDEQYAYAAGSLLGIAGVIRLTNRVTEPQRQAVRNIIAGAGEDHPRRGGRRYEGFNGRWR